VKVLHYIASRGMGRGEVYIDLVNELCKSINIVLLIPKGALYKNRIDHKIEIVEYTSYDSRKSPLLLIELFWKISKIKPDIVHTHFAKASQIFYLLNKILGLPHVATKHNARKGKIFNKLPHCIAVSADVKKSIKHENVKIIYNGIEPVKTAQANKNKIFTMLAVGRLDKIKGFDILLTECAKLTFPFLLQIVGEGEERKHLEALIDQYSLNKKVELLGFRKDIPQLMQNADVIVMSSHSEGFSLVMVESLFYADLFVSTKVSGATEILEDRFLCTHSTLAEKLNDIFLHQESYKDAFAKLKSEIQHNFLLEGIAKEHISYYNQVLSNTN